MKPHLLRLGLVEQRQDHRVDGDRLAGARRAGDQQVRHPARGPRSPACRRCPCRARASAGSSCRCTSSTTGSRPASRSAACGFGSSSPMHDLPGIVSTTRMLTTDSARARSFIRLTICAPLTPTAGSISKRVITGPGYAASTRTATPKSASLRSIRREVNSSVSALIDFLRRRRVVEQRERRQRRIGHVDEQRTLPLLDRALRFRNFGRRRHDDDRLVDDDVLLRVHDRFALGERLLAHARGRARSSERRAQPRDARLRGRRRCAPSACSHDMPENSDQPTAKSTIRKQRRAVEAGDTRERTADHVAEHAARRAAAATRAAGRSAAPRARRSTAARGRSPGCRARSGCSLRALGMADAPIAGDDEHDAGDDPPPRGNAEQIEQEIRKPRAGDAALVRDRRADARRRPRGIVARVRRRARARARRTRRRR